VVVRNKKETPIQVTIEPAAPGEKVRAAMELCTEDCVV
jgi:hypothetical protein